MAAINAVQSSKPPFQRSLSSQIGMSHGDAPQPPGMMDIEMDDPTPATPQAMLQQASVSGLTVSMAPGVPSPWSAAFRPPSLNPPACVPPSVLSYAPPAPSTPSTPVQQQARAPQLQTTQQQQTPQQSSAQNSPLTAEQMQARVMKKAQKKAEREAKEAAEEADHDLVSRTCFGRVTTLLTYPPATWREEVPMPNRGLWKGVQAGQWSQVPPDTEYQLWARQCRCHGRADGVAGRGQGRRVELLRVGPARVAGYTMYHPPPILPTYHPVPHLSPPPLPPPTRPIHCHTPHTACLLFLYRMQRLYNGPSLVLVHVAGVLVVLTGVELGAGNVSLSLCPVRAEDNLELLRGGSALPPSSPPAILAHSQPSEPRAA